MRNLPVEFVRGVVSASDCPAARFPEIAFSGRSNVGKSSLLNRLVGIRGMARVSRTPGKTREINFYLVDGRFHLVDLPGYGYARVHETTRRLWGPLVEGYLAEREQLSGVVQLVDSRHGPSKLDLAMVEWLYAEEIPTIVVATKIDKLSRAERTVQFSAMEKQLAPWAAAVLGVSAQTGDGVPQLWAWIEERRRAWNRGSKDR